jgi:hypothetical protein
LIFLDLKVLDQKNQFKKDIVTEIAATMAFRQQNNDKIGFVFRPN